MRKERDEGGRDEDVMREDEESGWDEGMEDGGEG